MFDGYLSDVHFIDGQALAPTNFGELKDSIWIPKVYNGTYGTNGFHLPFKNDDTVEGFNAVTFTAKSSTAESVSGLGFAPDFVWTKARNTAQSHQLFDSVRGDNKIIYTNLTNAESAQSAGYFTLENDGFNYGSSTFSANTYVAWAWDAGSGSAASNTNGSITSTVKANPDYGFSVVSYVGNGTHGTIGHGLSGLDMVMVKDRSTAENWAVWHSGIPITQYLRLNSTNAAATPVRKRWNDTSPTSTVFSVGDSTDIGDREVNQSGENYIAYCFEEVAGYSSISSYTGDGTTDGSKTITTGFRPSFVMMKNTSSGGTNWLMFDNTREPGTTIELELNANNNNSEGNNGRDVTFTNTGFTVAGNNNINGNGDTYIYMAFADTRDAAFWRDTSGNNNDWTPNNLDYRDSLPDSTTNNFATLNLLFTNGGATQNFKEGNLQFTADGNYAIANGTFAMRTGKWYWETYIKSYVSVPIVGISRGTNTGANSYVGYDPNGNVKGISYEAGGYIYDDGNGAGTSAGNRTVSGLATYTTGDIISCSFDADAGELKFYKNGTLIHTVSSVDEFDWMPATSAYNGGINIVNFGQDSTFAGAKTKGTYTDANNIGNFQYAPPAGYLALCTANLPEPTIIDGSENFNTMLYTGTGTTDQAVTGVGFQPDFTWIKSRSNTYAHWLNDSVRGAGKGLRSDATDAEYTTLPIFLSFDTDGFTVDVDTATANNTTNGSGSTFAAWNWKAGGTAVSNTAGSITSQVSANTTAGFSIVSYTGTGSAATIGHGLNSAPEVVIIKDRDSAQDWNVYHADVGTTNILALNSTSAAYADGAAMINSTAPTSSVVHIGFGGASNGSGRNYIAYCFANTDSYLKAGSYVGNGSANGPFIYTGFRPAFWLMKSVSDATHWVIYDSARETFNQVQDQLLPNEVNAEAASGRPVDFLSNGVKIRFSSYLNDSGQTYIYLAFAENPFKYSNAR